MPQASKHRGTTDDRRPTDRGGPSTGLGRGASAMDAPAGSQASSRMVRPQPRQDNRGLRPQTARAEPGAGRAGSLTGRGRRDFRHRCCAAADRARTSPDMPGKPAGRGAICRHRPCRHGPLPIVCDRTSRANRLSVRPHLRCCGARDPANDAECRVTRSDRSANRVRHCDMEQARSMPPGRELGHPMRLRERPAAPPLRQPRSPASPPRQ